MQMLKSLRLHGKVFRSFLDYLHYLIKCKWHVNKYHTVLGNDDKKKWPTHVQYSCNFLKNISSPGLVECMDAEPSDTKDHNCIYTDIMRKMWAYFNQKL
jgi:hypothetical protein